MVGRVVVVEKGFFLVGNDKFGDIYFGCFCC